MTTLQPLTQPAVGPSPLVEHHSPVRDDRALGDDEDLDREPDGVPHSVVGLTAGFSTVLALLVGFMFLAGGTTLKVLAVLLLLVAIPSLVGGLRHKANRDRDAAHPSR